MKLRRRKKSTYRSSWKTGEKRKLKFARDFVKPGEITEEKEAAEKLLEEKMERWMYLEDLAARIEKGEEV